MPFTHYPFGVSASGAPILPSIYGKPIGFGGKGNVTGSNTATITPGPGSNVYFVNSALATASDAAASNGADPLRPFKTINFAVSRCLANNGDIVYVGAGHVETIGAAAAMTIGIAGVTIVCMGNEVDRATINFTATAGTVTITAANTVIIGALFTSGIDAIVNGVVVSAADCQFYGCEWRDGPAFNTLIQIRTTAAANRLVISNYRYYEDLTGGGTQKTEAIRIVGGDNHLLENFHIVGSFSTGIINNITTTFTNSLFRAGVGSFVLNNTHASGLAMAVLTSSTGVVDEYVLTVGTGAVTVTAASSLIFNANGTFGVTNLGTVSGAPGVEAAISKILPLPQTGNQTTFTVNGGPIQILSIIGLVTTVIGSVANVTKITLVPAVGGANTDITTGVDLNAAAAGDLYILQTSYATAAALATSGIESIAQIAAEKPVYPITFAPGIVRITTAGSDGGTGRMQWCMRYKPLASGVSVS